MFLKNKWFYAYIMWTIVPASISASEQSCGEHEEKQSVQHLRTGKGVSSFTQLSWHRDVAKEKLAATVDSSTQFPKVLTLLVLSYCTTWKKYAEIPTVDDTYVTPNIAFIRYQDRECLIAQDDVHGKGNDYENDDFFESLPLPLNVWDTETGSLCAQIPYKNLLRKLCATADMKTFIFFDHDATIHIYDAHTLKRTAILSGPSLKSVRTLEISPDNQMLAIACFNNEVRLWDIKQQKITKKLKHPSSDYMAVGKLCFSPNSLFLIGQCFDIMFVWNRDTDTYGTLKEDTPDEPVSFVNNTTAICPRPNAFDEENRLASYEISTTNEKVSIASNFISPPKIEEKIFRIISSLNGQLLAADCSKHIYIIDAHDKTEIAKILLDNGALKSNMFFSPTGRYLAAMTKHSERVTLMHKSYDIDETQS